MMMMTTTRALTLAAAVFVAAIAAPRYAVGFAPPQTGISMRHPPSTSILTSFTRGMQRRRNRPRSYVAMDDARNGGRASAMAARNDDGEGTGGVDDDVVLESLVPSIPPVVAPAPASTSAPSPPERLRAAFKRLGGPPDDDGMSTRERLAKMGLSALLSYGFVSNMSYAVSVSLAWYGFSKRTGTSPLAPGQWKPFLAVYAGFYVFNNIVRPLRFGASVVVAKYFDSFVDVIQRKTKLPRKWSIATVVFLCNVCGTFAAMGFGISLASGAAGVPIFPP